MGQGYSLCCKKCGYNINVNLGVGFMFPRVYEETLENAKAGKLGRNVQQFLKDHPDGALDCDWYCCNANTVAIMIAEWICQCICLRSPLIEDKKASGQLLSQEIIIHTSLGANWRNRISRLHHISTHVGNVERT